MIDHIVVCPNCGRTYTDYIDYAGGQAKCRECREAESKKARVQPSWTIEKEL